FQAEDGIRDFHVTGVQTCALPILCRSVAQALNPLDMTVRECMSSEDIACVLLDTDIDECCKIMEDYQIRRVPVVDEHNCVIGIEIGRAWGREGAAAWGGARSRMRH